MTEKFTGVDEFTSARIRREVASNHGSVHTEIGRSLLVGEVRDLTAIDPEHLVPDASASAERDASALALHVYKKAHVRARLEHLSEFHSAMRFEEAKSFFSQLGFEPVLEQPSGPDYHASWFDPLTGMIAAGHFSQFRNDARVYFQFSPNVPSMDEKEEVTWTMLAERLLGGAASYSWFNPARPHLNHSQLHYAKSYPDLEPAALKAWEADYRSIPPAILAERGQWVMVVDGRPEAGIQSILETLHRRDVRFVVEWEAAPMLDFAFRKILNCDPDEMRGMFETTSPAFQQNYARSFQAALAEIEPCSPRL